MYYEGELKRAERLAPNAIISEREVERASLEYETARAQVESTKAQLELRMRELEAAQARLLGPEQIGLDDAALEKCCVAVRAPVNGTILRVPSESERIVQAGSTLVEIGNLLIRKFLSTFYRRTRSRSFRVPKRRSLGGAWRGH